MAVSTKKIGLIFMQILVGCLAGALVGWGLLTLINLAWRGLQQLPLSDFLTGLLLLISFLTVFSATIIATAEGVRLMGTFLQKQASRRRVYEGSFLGICSAVAILTATRGDWINTLDEWGGPIKLIATLLYFVVVIPAKLATFWLPSLFLLIIAAPIGASLAYNLPSSGKEKRKGRKSKDEYTTNSATR